MSWVVMSEKKFHEKIKNFLIELGEKEGYKSYSGDSEPLDIRLRKKRIEYKPDVIWKRRETYYVFEIAFTEDWRAIVGEYTLSWLKECSRFFVFTYVDSKDNVNYEYDFLNSLLTILGKTFKETTWYFWVFTKEDARNFKKTKIQIKKWLRKYNFIR
jgi:hypothetical protein